MDIQTTSVILIFLTLLVAGYAAYRLHKQGVVLTPTTVVSELKSAQPMAQELLNVAQIGVQAAEQLKSTGKLPNNDAAFEYALNFVKRWIPGGSDISNKDIESAIESAVLTANYMTSQIEANRDKTIPVFVPSPPVSPIIPAS